MLVSQISESQCTIDLAVMIMTKMDGQMLTMTAMTTMGPLGGDNWDVQMTTKMAGLMTQFLVTGSLKTGSRLWIPISILSEITMVLIAVT